MLTRGHATFVPSIASARMPRCLVCPWLAAGQSR